LTGVIHLQAVNDLAVQTSLTLANGGQSLFLEAGNNLTVSANSVLATYGTLSLYAASPTIPGFNLAGALTVLGDLVPTNGSPITLHAGTGGITLAGTLRSGILDIKTTGPLVQTSGGITAGTLNGTSSSASLPSRTNAIGSVGTFSQTLPQYAVTGAAGDFTLVDSVKLVIGNSPSQGGGISVQPGRTVSLTVDTLVISSRNTGNTDTANPVPVPVPATISAPGGTIAITQFTPDSGVEVTSSINPAVPPKILAPLSLTLNELSNTDAATLQLASQSPTQATPQAGSITLGRLGEAIDLKTHGGYGTLVLAASGAVTQGGALTVRKVSGQADTLAFGAQDNGVTELGGFKTNGALAFRAAANSLVSGPVTAGSGLANVTLSTNRGFGHDLTLGADVAGATVSMDTATGRGSSPGGINQTAGVISATTLTLKAGAANLNDQNRVATLGDATTDAGLNLTNAPALVINGKVVNQTGAVTLTAPSVVQTPSSSIVSPVLSGTAAAASFTSAANRVDAIGSFQAPGGFFALTDAVPLSIGAINAANGRVTLVTDRIDLTSAASSINAPNGSVTLSPLTAGRRIELIDVAAANLGLLALSRASVADPGSLTLSQAFLNTVNTTTLAIGGPGVTGAINIGNNGEAISLVGHAATLQLQTAGIVTEGNTGTASLAVGDLVGRTGTMSLTGANAIATLGRGNPVPGTLTGYISTGAVALTAAGPLAVSGAVAAGGALAIRAAGLATDATISGASVALTASGGDLLQTAGSLSAPGTMALTASGAVTQAGGTLAAATLTGAATSLSLPNATLANLGPYTTTGAFQLTNAGALNVSGAVQTGDASLALLAGGLTLNAAVRAGAVALAMPGAVEQLADGSLQAATLTGHAGSVNLGPGSRIGTLGGFVSIGGFTLLQGGPGDPAPLTVAGAVSDKTRIGLDVYGPITLSGTATSPAISLRAHDVFAASENTNARAKIASGSITQTAGGLVTDSLSGGADALGSYGPTSLTATGNSIGSVAFSSKGGFSLTNGRSLAVAGLFDDARIALDVTGDLGITGNLRSFNDASPPALITTATGAITQTGNEVQVSRLNGSAAKASFASIGVAILGDFATKAGLSLAATQGLSVAGTVKDEAAIALSSVGPLALSGTLTAPAISLTAASIPNEALGTITQTGGTIATGALASLSGATTSLGSAGNSVRTIASAQSTGGFALANGRSLAVTGPMNDGTQIALTVAGDLSLAGTLASAGLVTKASGTITQPGGSLQVGSLSGSAGSASFGQAGNKVGTLGAFAAGTGDLLLTDSAPLTIGGAVSAGTGRTIGLDIVTLNSVPAGSLAAPGGTVRIAALSPAGLTVSGTIGASLPVTATTLVLGVPTGGPVTITSALNLSNVSVLDLESGGAIMETGSGAIRVGRLTGNAASAALDGPNQITTLGAFTTTGAFSLTDLQALTIGGPLAASVATLGVTGDLALNSSVTGNTVRLAATGAITESADGVVNAATLTGSASTANLARANGVAELGSFSAPGGLVLTDAQDLVISGPVKAGTLGLTAPNVAFAGTVDVGTLNVSVAGRAQQTGGTLNASTLTGLAGSGASIGANGYAVIGQLGPFSVGNGSLAVVDAGPLTINGPLRSASIGIVATGQMTLAGGSLTTDGLPLAQQRAAGPTQPGSFLQVRVDSAGNGRFIQSGTTSVLPLLGTTATLRIDLPAAGGTLSLNDLSAPTTDLVLSLGAGSATGKLHAANLLVLGSGGRANLTGTVAGQNASGAAQASRIDPRFDGRYLLNNCAIQSFACAVQPTFLAPQSLLAPESLLRPDILTLDVLSLSVTRDRDDPTFLLPNISDRDY